MVLSKRAACDSQESRVIKEQEARRLLGSLVIKTVLKLDFHFPKKVVFSATMKAFKNDARTFWSCKKNGSIRK